MDKNANERRTAPRRIAYLAAEIEVDGEVLGCGLSWDASATGLLLVTQRPLNVGEEVLLRVRVLKEERPRQLEGRVVRCDLLPSERRDLWKFEAGIELRNPPTDLESIVRHAADGYSSKWPPPVPG